VVSTDALVSETSTQKAASSARDYPTQLRDYYNSKTAALLNRYGPGPRVHFHLGLFDQAPNRIPATAAEIRRQVVAAQERLLDHCATVWDAGNVFTGRLLDIGCGLGGGAIYWAQRYGAEVTAATIAHEHAGVVTRLAGQGGVSDRVHPLVGDFTTSVPVPDGGFDAAVSVLAICCMNRDAVFANAANALNTGGYLCIEDVVVTDPSGKEPFDAYWTTDIGTAGEYYEAAHEHGFVLDREVENTDAQNEFWVWSMAWAEAELTELAATGALTPEEELRLLRSIREHARLWRGYRQHLYEHRIFRFRKVRSDHERV